MSAPRVVSLIASSTEIVCALGFEDALVGRSHECDFPPAVRGLPACTEPRIDVEASSARIDEEVKSFLKSSLSVYRVDAERLRGLKPDVVITQSHCEVCAVSLKDVERSLGAEWGFSPTVVSLTPNSLPDIWRDIHRVAEALGEPRRGEALVESLKARMDAVARGARGLDKPRTACVEWIEPLMAAGNWMPELVELAGGAPLFGKPGAHSPSMGYAEFKATDPDVVIVMPCGFDLDRTRREMPALSSQPGFSGLRAVRQGRVCLADGNQYFNRPGPRLAESLEILAEILHPEKFQFGHQGKAWEKYHVESL